MSVSPATPPPLWSAPSPDQAASEGTAPAAAAVSRATAGSSARQAGSSAKGASDGRVHSGYWAGEGGRGGVCERGRRGKRRSS